MNTDAMLIKNVRSHTHYSMKSKFAICVIGLLLQCWCSFVQAQQSLNLDILDTTEYGYLYNGNSENRESAEFVFEGFSNDIYVTIDAFDIDTEDEVAILVNSNKISNLHTTSNNITSTGSFVIPFSSQTTGLNTLKFVHKNPGWKWGIKNILLSADDSNLLDDSKLLMLGILNPLKYGYSYDNNFSNRNAVKFYFYSNRTNLSVTLDAYDIDVEDEVAISVNGAVIANLHTTDNNNTSSGTFTIPVSSQTNGINTLEFKQKVSGWKWGISNLLLTIDDSRLLDLGTLNSNQYGYSFNGVFSNRESVDFIFVKHENNLRLTLDAYDIDPVDEVEILLNGNPFTYLHTTNNNSILQGEISIPITLQTNEFNTITFIQKSPGWKWGITNLILNSDSSTPNKNGFCEDLHISNDRFTVPVIDKPPFKQYYKDPIFNSKTIRISNTQLGEVIKPAYSTMQAWNADETLMLLYKSTNDSSGHMLYDGRTYEPLYQLDITPADIEEVFWSHTDPNEFFYVSKRASDFGEFKRYSISDSSSSYITDFQQICGADNLPIAGDGIHMQSIDDDLFGFRCQNDDGNYVMLSYRISTDETITKTIGDGTNWLSNIAPTPAASGERFWYQGSVLNTDLDTIETQLDLVNSNEHSNVGLTHDGNDALYQIAFNSSPDGCNGDIGLGVGHLIEHNLETGSCRSIINEEQGYPYSTSATHISAQAYHQPGIVAMSSIGDAEQMAEFFSGDTTAPALFSEIYLTDTNPDSQATCRLAHHRSFGKLAVNGSYPAYFGEPHVTISPSGTRLLFGSDWYDSGSVDSYIIELPNYTQIEKR